MRDGRIVIPSRPWRGRRHRSPLTMDTAVTAGRPARSCPGWARRWRRWPSRRSGCGYPAWGWSTRSASPWPSPGRSPGWSSRGPRTAPGPHWLIALGALAGAVALTAARLGGQDQAAGQHAARVLATAGRARWSSRSASTSCSRCPTAGCGRPGRRLVAGLGYASAVGTGIVAGDRRRPFPLMAGALIWPLAVLSRPAGDPAALPQGGGPRQGADAVAGAGAGGGRHRRADQRRSPSARGLARVGRRGGGQRLRRRCRWR